VVEVYNGVFTSLGASEVISLRPESRTQAQDPDLVEPLGKVSAIFLTGGNQLKLSSFITGTPFGDGIQEAYQRGTVQEAHLDQRAGGGCGGHQRIRRRWSASRRRRGSSLRLSWGRSH
jgi:hypothetical protein